MKTMKAIRVHQFGGPEVLKYETNAPMPKYGDKDVLINVKSVGVNPVETYIRSGQYARLPTLPFTPGHDCAGVVEEVGSGVTTFKKGDRVWVSRTKSGAYAEYTTAPTENVHPLPDVLTYEQGANLPTPYLTAYRALFFKAKMRPGENVLVHGASGGVGTAAVQLARAYGARVFGSAGSEEGMGVVKKAGAHHVVNHRSSGYLDEVRKLSKGGLDVIIENASHINLGQDLTLLGTGGRVAVVGSRGPIEVNPRDAMSREASIVGVMLFNSTERELAESHHAIQAGIANGWLRPLVGMKYPLERACDAHADIMSSTGAVGKMILCVD